LEIFDVESFEARKAFLEFFEAKGHKIVQSASLVPANDKTLLFVNAGMVQFKELFLGLETRPYARAASSQRCMRVSGKHNDLEDVGASVRHNTFFEMLGNFSFGDYFKQEAIEMAWEFVTNVAGLSPDRIWPTVYEDDDDAFGLWQEVANVPEERITLLGAKNNFWSMGDIGPCGPCSELVYDRGVEKCTCHRSDCHLRNDDCDRWMEFWNLVFMQYNMEADGTLNPLAKPCVDTGMGLERLLLLANGQDSVYDTDLLFPQMQVLQELTGESDKDRDKNLYAYRTIADHIRSITFLISDGIMPGNEGRTYILRLLMRRAIRFGRTIGIAKPFLGQVAHVVIGHMGKHYHELVDNRDFITEVIAQEEERFQQTLASGLTRLENLITEAKSKRQKRIPGDKIFQLYDTFGFPPMLTRDVARERGLEIDEQGFEKAMEEQKERSRSTSRFEMNEWERTYRDVDVPATIFTGYDQTVTSSKVLILVTKGKKVSRVSDGDEVEVTLDQTPFYAESGGQVGDMGVLEGPTGNIKVENTKKPVPTLTVHMGRVTKGEVQVGDQIRAKIDKRRRQDIAHNHTATHLLHKALQMVLGAHVKQAGSLVAPDRLRFDFIHLEAMKKDELAKVEKLVNQYVREDLPIQWEIMDRQKAIE